MTLSNQKISALFFFFFFFFSAIPTGLAAEASSSSLRRRRTTTTTNTNTNTAETPRQPPTSIATTTTTTNHVVVARFRQELLVGDANVLDAEEDAEALEILYERYVTHHVVPVHLEKDEAIVATCVIERQEILETTTAADDADEDDADEDDDESGYLLLLDFTVTFSSSRYDDVTSYPRLFRTWMRSNSDRVLSDLRTLVRIDVTDLTEPKPIDVVDATTTTTTTTETIDADDDDDASSSSSFSRDESSSFSSSTTTTTTTDPLTIAPEETYTEEVDFFLWGRAIVFGCFAVAGVAAVVGWFVYGLKLYVVSCIALCRSRSTRRKHEEKEDEKEEKDDEDDDVTTKNDPEDHDDVGFRTGDVDVDDSSSSFGRMHSIDIH